MPTNQLFTVILQFSLLKITQKVIKKVRLVI